MQTFHYLSRCIAGCLLLFVALVNAVHAAPPGAPTGLTVFEGSPGVARGSLVPPSNDGGSPITGYRIERATGTDGDFMELTFSDPTQFGIIGTTFLGEPGLRSVTTYRYRVFAINNDGVGPASNIASIMTGTRVPDPPRNLTATSTRPDEIILNWVTPADDGGTPIIGYHIRRVTLPSRQAATTLVANAGVVTSYTDTVPVGTSYSYEVFAISTLKSAMPPFPPRQSLSSGRVDATSASPAIAPDAPTGLMGAVQGQSQIDLTWTASLRNGGAPITGYRIERSSQTSFAALVVAGSTTLGVTEFMDTGLDPGSTYHYRIKAVNSAGNSAPSNTFSGTTRASNTVPDAPTGLMEVVQNQNQIDLTWTAPLSNGGSPITGYRIERATGTGGNFMDLVADTMDPATTSYNDTGLMAATTYRYRVSTINALGTGATSNTVTAMTTAVTAPSVPRAFSSMSTENIILNRNNLTLNWLPPLDDGGVPITGYIIERYVGSITVDDVIKDPSDATFDTRNSPNPTATSYTDVTMQLAAVLYFYRIRAVNQNSLEGPELPTLEEARQGSYRAGTSLIISPAAPTGLTGVAQGQDQIELTWTVPEDFGVLGSSSFTGYRIERATGTSGNFMELAANTMDSATSYNDTGLMAATTYRYRVSAVNTSGPGDVSNVATVTTAALTAAPSISISPATVTAIAGTAIADISITSSGGAVASYSIDPAIGNGLSFSTSTGSISGTPTAAANEITYTITATNASDTDTATVAITVNAAPVAVAAPSISISPATVTATAGTAIADISIDASAGGAVASYSIMPAITNGLSFDASTGTISGTPTAAANEITYTITATNASDTDTATVAITVNAAPVAVAAPSISISPATVTATVGTAIADISITSSGGAVASYSIAPDISNGLLFDTSTGTISGTPTAAANEITYTITATNASDTDTATVAITVNAAPVAVAAPSISISPATVTAIAGTAIADISIDASAGGAVASYSIMPAITNGLSFDASTGTISGTPTAAANEITYTITATNASDTDTATVAITVNAAPVAVAAPSISISPATVTATVGTAIADISITSSGGAVASYSIAPDISNGLLFDTSTGTISGTPTAAANEITYTITATNASDTDTATVAITVNAAPVAVAAPSISISPATVTAIAGTAIADISIDASAGGAVASYSIMPAITNGLSFDASTGTISGTPTAAANEITYTITATNASDTDTATVAITVNAAPVAVAAPSISISPATVTAIAGTAIADISIDASAGGAVASYSIMPAITNGLSFDASTGTISGTPTAAANEITYTITATNASDTDTATVAITVNAAPVAVAAPSISISPATVTAIAGTAIADISIDASAGGAVASYSIMPAITNGLSFDASTGTISGTPTAAANEITYTITATNASDTDTATVAITVNAAPVAVAAPSISISPATVTATVGTAIADISITSSGGAVASYSIAPDISNGLLFDTSTGTISGTPTAAANEITYTITATNASDTDTATVAITVNAAPVAVAAPSISISPATVTAIAGTAIADISIDASAGGAVASYSIMPAITNGLSFDASTGTISGTPTAAANEITYTITATNASDTDTATVAITVNAAPVAVAAPSISITPATVTATAGTAIADITIDASAGGAVASYSIMPAITNGLSFDASTGTISGTPTAAANEITYTITATNASDTDTATVAITVNAALAAPDISPSVTALTATQAVAITPITIDASAGGAVASYSITPAIGNGLMFDPSTGTISGTPTSPASALTYTITANGVGMPTVTASASVEITVNVAAPIISINPSTLTATVGTPITTNPITIINTGGAVASYSINPDLPAGLSIDTSTGEISGTPTAVANAVTYTITATNSAGMNSAMVTISVQPLPVPIISVSSNMLTATVGTVITPITIINTGGAVASYSISQQLPAGLSIDTTTGSISGTPTAVANAVTYTITATNSAGMNSAMVTISVQPLPVPSISTSVATLIANVGTAITPITINASAGGAVASYSIMPVITNGLSFDTTTGSISGTPTAVAAAVTYIITATNNAGTNSASVEITVNVAAPIISINPSTLTATVGTPITTNPITIINTGGAVASYSINPDLPAGLSIDTTTGSISGTPTAVADAVTYIITATNSAGMNSAMVTITVQAATNSLMGVSALNDEILSKLTQGTVASIMTAVSNRMDTLLSTGTPPKASYQLDGQTLQLNNQAQLLGYIRSLKDGSMDWKRILSNLSLVLPLNTAGNTAAGSGSRHDLGYGSGLSLWAGGDYLSLDGDSDIDWSGDLFSAQFGIDKRIDKHLLLGTMVSWSEGDADYTQDTNTGSYNHQSLSVHPYLAWSNQGNHLWGSVGYGEGELEIEDNSNSNTNNISSDTRLWSFATGAKAGLSKVPGLSLKGDFLWARTDIDNPLVDNALDARIREQSIDSQRLRLLLEFEHTYGLSGGLLRPLIELGMRYDGGDGDTGIGAILGTGLRYTNGGLTMEGKLHTLLGRDDYREWGVQGTIVLDPGLRGQGLAFSLTPGYGYGDVGVSGSSQIWQGLPKGPRDQGHQNQNYRGRLQANMGYGFFTSGGGLLTPYGEVRLSNSRYYRLGMRWNPNIPFSLNLFGEHQTGNDSIGNSSGNSAGDNNAILLEGQMQF